MTRRCRSVVVLTRDNTAGTALAAQRTTSLAVPGILREAAKPGGRILDSKVSADHRVGSSRFRAGEAVYLRWAHFYGTHVDEILQAAIFNVLQLRSERPRGISGPSGGPSSRGESANRVRIFSSRSTAIGRSLAIRGSSPPRGLVSRVSDAISLPFKFVNLISVCF